MKRAVRTVIALLVSITPLAAAADWKSEIDTLFSEWDANDSPGAMVYIARDREVEFSKGYGMANIEKDTPITESTMFNVASVSKQFTAAAIALLVTEGKLDLDQDVRELLPYLPDYGHTVRIRHMIHHTSGITDVLGLVDSDDFEGGWGNQDVLPILTEIGELKFTPGEKYEYSNSNYFLLAEIVEKVSGMSFREFVDTRIFQPLGMTEARVDDNLDHLEDDNVALSYRKSKRRPAIKIERNDYLVGDGNVVVSARDFAKWQRNFTTREVGSEAFHELILSTRPLNNGEPNPYAFGISVGEHHGRTAYMHSGSWLGFRTIGIYYPEERVSLIVFANHNRYKLLHDEIAEIYFDAYSQ